jgi:mannose-6-phosphate isomerase-like protein (cupin superfamily)
MGVVDQPWSQQIILRSTMSSITIADTTTHADLHVFGDTIRPLVTPSMGGEMEMFDLRGHRGSGPVLHAHPYDEAYFVLEGTVVIIDESTEQEIGVGMTVMIPAGVVHAYRITSEAARFLVVSSGHRLGKFFEESDAEVKTLPEDLEKLIAIAKRNGITSPLFT